MSMANIFARNAFSTLKRAHISSRGFRSTVPALKKKSKVDVEDLFADDFVDQELVKNTPKVAPSAPSSSAAAAKSNKRTVDERAERFKSEFEYVKARIGRTPSIPNGRVRKRALVTLIDLASSREQLAEVVSLIPKYRTGGGELVDSFATMFVQRCQLHNCPDLALEVFGNFASYNVKLTLKSARALVHSLYVKHPFKDLLLAANLFTAYGLPSVEEDLPSAAMVAAACYKEKSPQALKIAESLRPKITAMLEQTNIFSAPDVVSLKNYQWTTWALTRVNNATKKAGQPYVPLERIPLKHKIKLERPAKGALLS